MEHGGKFYYLNDPLSDTSRKARRNLLVTSTMAIFIALTDNVPEEISALGITLTEVDKSILTIIIIIILIYLLISFLLNATSEFLMWLLTVYKTQAEEKFTVSQKTIIEDMGVESRIELLFPYYDRMTLSEKDQAKNMNKKLKQEIADWLEKKTGVIGGFSKPITVFRVIIDIGFPILLSIWAIFLLTKLV